jgi:hypothetical protein
MSKIRTGENRMKKLKIYGTIFCQGIMFLLPTNDRTFCQTVVKTVYVSTDGNDQNDGTLQQPLKTIGGAVDKLKKSGNETVARRILVLPGVYDVSQTTSIGDRTELKGRLEIAASESGKAVFSGGLKIERSRFSPLNKASVIARVTPKAARNIIVCNISKQVAGNIPALRGASFGDDFLPVSPELFEDSAALKLARWPNDSMLRIEKVIVKGDSAGSQGATHGKDALPQFIFEKRQHRSWQNAEDAWVTGYFANLWSYSSVQVDSIGLASNFVRLKKKIKYGVFSSDDQSTPDIGRAKSSRGLYFYNVLEELDEPGEWYLDRSTGDLYVWPQRPDANFTLTNFSNPILRLTNARNISIKEIVFQHTRGKAIEVQNSSNIDISNCAFFGIGLQAITISKSDSVVINKCRIRETGAGGIILNGGDRKTLVSSHNIVQNSEISRYSRVYKSYAPAISIFGVGTTVDNCFIHDAPDQAIVFTGNNHIIQNTVIANVCMEFGDMGAVYTGRDPSSTGTIIRNNIFDSIVNKHSGMIAAVYLDDGTEGIKVLSNLFNKCGSSRDDGFGAIMIHGGGFNVLESNIFTECGRAVSNTPWTNERWKKTFVSDKDNRKLLTEVVDIRSEAYTKSYKHLRNFFGSDSLAKRINGIYNSVWVNVPVPRSGNGLEEKNSVNLHRKFKGAGAVEWALFSDEIRKATSGWQDFKPINLKEIKWRNDYADGLFATSLSKYFSRPK